VRIAHFSDIHALTLDGMRPWQWLSKRVAGYANLLTKRRNRHPVALFEALVADVDALGVDEVVVTGDLTNLSLEGEYLQARGILDRLQLGPGHVTLIPGNHDVYTIDALLGGGFQRVFAPYLASDDGRQPFPVVRRRGDVAIVGVSTARPSPVPLADGWVGRKQLAAVEKALAAHEGAFRVLLIHHPPVDNRWSILRGLRDRGALQTMLARVGCELVLHGHEHRDIRTSLAGPRGEIPVIGVGSGSYDDHRPERRARYNVYTVEKNALTRVETRVFDPATRAFT
jgi:3',5'-cyclic AMP phosphodiesterase CpdA